MISYGKEMSNVKCQMLNMEALEIILTTGKVANQPAPYKKYLVNGVGKRMVDFVGNLRCVLFWPEDMELVTNSPSRRRKYLDFTLSQVDREYRRCLLSYERGLRARNKLLERIRDENPGGRSQLLFWDQLLIKDGVVLTTKREEFLKFLNSFQFSVFSFQLEYDKSVISQARLEEYAQEEVAAGATLVGPHRDDFRIRINPNKSNPNKSEWGRDLSVFGSRGEQRLAILWLKLAELEFITQKTGDPSTGSTNSPQASSGQGRPILLLDDIFSELDKDNQDLVTEVIPNQQTIITTTDEKVIKKEFLEGAKIVKLEI